MRDSARLVVVAMLAGHVLPAAAADGQGMSQPVGQSDWVVQVTPYLWASGMAGNVSPFRDAPTIHVEKSFSDVMEDFNVGGFLNIWARRDRFVFSGDIMYVDTSAAKTTRVLPDIFPGGVEVNGELDSVEFNATAQAGYRLVDTPRFTFDALAGGRYWYVSNDVTINVEQIGRISRSEDFHWIDPVVGPRAFYNLTERLSVMGQADIGGFGVGSDLTWSVLATMNYVVNDRLSLSAGYKHLAVDYDHDGYVFDVDLSGPVLGVTYRFN